MEVDRKPFVKDLTKREYFAAMAMQGWLSMGTQYYTDYEKDDMIHFAVMNGVETADALIVALEAKQENPISAKKIEANWSDL